MFLGSALISWKSIKQARFSKSSIDWKYRTMSTTCSEIIWLHGLLAEHGIPQGTPTPLYADNTRAIQLASNPVFHERGKHIEVECHSIREALDDHVISLSHVSSKFQLCGYLYERCSSSSPPISTVQTDAS